MRTYSSNKLELSIQDDILLWGCRVVVPEVLRARVLNELHSGHVGICRMKSLARSYFWWPSLDHDIEIWHRVHINYAGLIDVCYFLIIIDAHSKWPEIVKTSSMTAHTTITCLRSCFARFGIPVSVVSDSGTCFISSDFDNFMKLNSIMHIKTAVYINHLQMGWRRLWLSRSRIF